MLQHFYIERNYNTGFLLPTIELIEKFGIIAAKMKVSYKGSWGTGRYVSKPDKILTLPKNFTEQSKIDFLDELLLANTILNGVIYHTESTWSFIDNDEDSDFWAYVECPDIDSLEM
jgi:hypothetical protein